ncbi:PREDICTED: hemicentin-1-like isoform X1 [Amphimedon queenslandica]|uniref:Uncharacterized protein n=1 Tax=Amphimedon queenslandica TaxID=400682 RepID=A0AAN0IZT4_AMPQE|nr:PREDICTED: hemicentin-1-like isoform X1 [Amphimedon queenslandica]|eukprot:XP_019850052.1 PREDICTED: hemicentin-1-like isoform X1 [Amphimedon queenslandica]
MVYGLQQFVGYSYTGNLELKPSESCFLLCQANYVIDAATCTCVCQGNNCSESSYTTPNISALVSYVAVLNGSSVTLRCVLHHAGNPGAAIQWTYAGSVITNDSLFLITEGSTRLDITNITTSYSGAYHCNASNVVGASVATINVDIQEPPYFIVTPPNNLTLRYNNTITLNCSSGGVPLPNITWFKDGIVIPTDQYTSSNTSDTIITMLTVVGSLISGGNYTCQAVNDLVERRVVNTTVNVTVFEYLDIVLDDDTDYTFTLNQSDTFIIQCSFSGFPLPTIDWFFGTFSMNSTENFFSNSSRVSITTSIDIQDITVTSTLTVKNVDKATDEGMYSCTSRDMYVIIYSYKILDIVCNNDCEAGYTLDNSTCACSLSNICELGPCQNGGSCTLVSAPSNYTCDCTGTGYQGINCTDSNYIAPNISALVSNVAVLNGSSVTLRCVLHHAGNPGAAIQWTFAGSVITNDSLFLITEDSTRLDITNITTSYSGAYHCIASNVAGASVATISVDVQEPPYFIVTPPNSILLQYNNTITLNCSSGGVPLPNITWFKDGIVIPTDQYTSSNTSDTIITMLTVVGSLTSDGIYTCQAVNDLVERRIVNTTVNVTVFEPLNSAGSDPPPLVTLNQSDTFIANCSFSGIPLPTVFWFFISNDSRVSVTTDIQGITVTSTLTVKNVDKATDEGVYECTAFQQFGGYHLSFVLYLNIVCNNSCEAGYTLDNSTCTCSLSNICELGPCQNGGSCTLVSAPSNYTCDCTGTGYQGINCTNFLGIPPSITAPKLNYSVLNGSSATLTCTLENVGTPVAAITWRFNGSTLSNSFKYTITNSTSTLPNTAGSTQLVINDVMVSDAGVYYCQASNGGGTSAAGITLNVQVPPSIISTSNVTQVQYKTVLTLNCTASGVPRPVVTWSKDGGELPNEQILNKILTDSVLSSAFRFEGSLTSTGQYTCTAVNDLVERRVASGTINILTYEPLQFNKGLIGNYSIQSEPYTAYCNFTALPHPNVLWARDGITLYSNTDLSITTDVAGITLSSTLTIRNLNKKKDEGNYTCTATSLQYSHTFSGKLQIEVPAVVRPDSNRFSAVINTTSHISFSITNQNDLIRNHTIQWNFKRLGTNTYTPLNSEIFDTSRLSDDGLRLMFSSAQLQHRGTYRITVSNPAANVTATTNFDVFVPAKLQYTAGMSIVKERRQNVSFNCSADGIPMPTIVWRKDGQFLIQNNKRSITEQGSTGFRSNAIPGVLQINSMLTITGLTGSDNGSYSCRADNEANIGSVLIEPFILSVVEPPPPDNCLSSPCVNGDCHSLFDGYYCACPETHTGINCEEVVLVTVPPVITEPPQTTTSKLYSSTSLTCRATGSPTPTILWYKDNRLVPNTNPDPSVLLFDELLLSDRGFYHCVAVNVIDGKNVSVSSSTILLNITNVVQYEAEMVLPDNFYDNLNGTESEDAIRQLIIDSNNYLSGSNISDTSFFFIQILDIDEDNPEPGSIPVVVTLVTERGQGDQTLLTGVRGQLDSLRQQLRVEISVAAVSRFDGCLSNSTIIPSPSGDPSLSLTVNWPETNIGVLSVVDCPCGSNGTSGGGSLKATRYCGGDFTDGAMWLGPDVKRCNFSDLARRICRLSDLPVNDKVEELETLTSNSSMLGSTEIAASVSVLVTATEELAGNLTLTMTFLEVVDNIIDVDQDILQESQESSNTSARILEAIDSVVDNIPIANASEPVIIAQKSFAVSVQEVDPEAFSRSGQTFSVNIADFTQRNISSGDLSFESNTVSPPTGTIQLPNNLFSSLPENISRISHAVFVTDSLFLRRSFSYQRVSSVIISASVVGAGTIRNLRPPVNLGFQLNPNVNGSIPQCTFWNQSLDDGYGDWSSDGCNTSSGSTDSQVTCNCDHLTNFAILLDVSPPEEPTERTALTLFLDSVSYIGIIISIICLIITIISYLLSKKLRSSDHGQLLLNLCFALMGLYLSFIVALHSKNTNGFCAFSGAVLQYFFLVTFAIMAAEAINLYINLVIVLGRKIQSFALKVTIVSWVAPVFIVLLCFSPDYRNYISSPPNFCRAFKAPFYIGVVVPFSIIYIFNWIVFVIIIVSLLRKNFSSKLKELKKAKKDKSKSFFKQQLIIAITLSILFGLGWGLGLLVTQEIYSNKTVRDLFAALFVLLTAFHGFFIFIMHCLRSKDVRKVWKKAFFGVTGRDFTEFSSSTFNRVRGKSSGGASTATRSPHRKVSTEKSPSFSFSDGKSFFKRGVTLQEYSKKKEAEDEEIKEIEETGVMAVENDYVAVDNNAYAAIEDTDFDFEKDGQGTLKFYTKKDQDHEAQFESLNDGKDSKKAKKEDGPPSKEGTELELRINVSSEVKEEEPKVATAVKSFPDDDEDEKGKLREEEERAYDAYHSKHESNA